MTITATAEWMARVGADDDELARRLNVSRSTVSRIRRGKARPSPPLAQQLIQLSDGELKWETLLLPQVENCA